MTKHNTFKTQNTTNHKTKHIPNHNDRTKHIFFVCELLGYVSRAVRPSVSWSYTKRTIQNREKRQKHSVTMARPKKNELIKQIHTNQSSVVEWVKDEKTIWESSHRRCTRSRRGIGAEQSLGSRNLRQERASFLKIRCTDDRDINA